MTAAGARAAAARVVTFTLPSLPPSVNEIYVPVTSVHTGKPRFEIKAEWRQWATVSSRYVKVFPIREHALVRFDAWLYYDFYYKNGNLRRIDSSNMMKYLIDVVAKHAGFDDCIVKSGSWGSSHDRGSSRVVVRLTEIMTDRTMKHEASSWREHENGG